MDDIVWRSFLGKICLEPASLKRFVEAVRALAPNSTDTPVVIREAGNAVVHSFLLAILYAFLAITLFMLIEAQKLFYQDITHQSTILLMRDGNQIT
jgi:hypothetical protein